MQGIRFISVKFENYGNDAFKRTKQWKLQMTADDCSLVETSNKRLTVYSLFFFLITQWQP